MNSTTTCSFLKRTFKMVLNLGDAADMVEEIHVQEPAAVLAVGDAPEPDRLLELDASRIASVLGHGAGLGGRDLACLWLLAGEHKARRMVCAEGLPTAVGAERRGFAVSS